MATIPPNNDEIKALILSLIDILHTGTYNDIQDAYSKMSAGATGYNYILNAGSIPTVYCQAEYEALYPLLINFKWLPLLDSMGYQVAPNIYQMFDLTNPDYFGDVTNCFAPIRPYTSWVNMINSLGTSNTSGLPIYPLLGLPDSYHFSLMMKKG